MSNPENQRLQASSHPDTPWKKWGPYLSERQWGTVREDYSPDGSAWEYFTHDQARSRAYRWGEDGLAGICDENQFLCFALALWNGNDPILKERLFGLSNGEGNHGEDVKDYYFYLDSTPTHSYMKYLYKYPQQAFPYADLVDTNAERGFHDPEYELLDTGVFEDNRYFDVFVEYAKIASEDLLIRIEVHNRGPEPAQLHLLPSLWFRNDWTWNPGQAKPHLRATESVHGAAVVRAERSDLGSFHWYCEGRPELLFTENETNNNRLFEGDNPTPHVKDGFHEYLIDRKQEAINPDRAGTKVAAWYELTVNPGSPAVVHLRLSKSDQPVAYPLSGETLQTFEIRKHEADEFYHHIYPEGLEAQEQAIFRQAMAGMLWTKQFYLFDLERWLSERVPEATAVRNADWSHMKAGDIISMPDKWEYPWFAVWDSAFHTVALVLADPDFAKKQIALFLEERFQHPNGQIPAYEWNFNDVNPPVHAWAAWMVYQEDRTHHVDGRSDVEFLKTVFDRLDRNFEWWGKLHGASGGETFKGGFLGLDNIGLFDRSHELPTGGYFEQSDGTAWMALYAQNMFQIATELAQFLPEYEYMALRYLDEFIQIAASMDKVGELEDEMWDEEDGFFYDVLRLPDQSAMRIKVRSMVGLLPLCAVSVVQRNYFDKLPQLRERYEWLIEHRMDLTQNIACPDKPGVKGRRLLAVMDQDKLVRVLRRLLDEEEFLSPYGIRSLSKAHGENPYQFEWGEETYEVKYLPGESDSSMFGGNSNWRGPVWFPMNFLILRALIVQYSYYGDDFKMEFPTGSGQLYNLYEIAHAIQNRLLKIFKKEDNGYRPFQGRQSLYQEDPHWKDLWQFYEYFHGETGEGLGASHQTGWTGTIANGMDFFMTFKADRILDKGLGIQK